MTSVLFRCPENPDEWAFIELQGELDSRTKVKGGFSGMRLGKMTIENNKPHLRIGNLALEGRVQKLSKPLVVCKTIRTPKVNATHPSPISPSSPSSSDAMVDHKQSDSHMQVHGVVRRKYIFKTRPNPIISSAEPDSSA